MLAPPKKKKKEHAPAPAPSTAGAEYLTLEQILRAAAARLEEIVVTRSGKGSRPAHALCRTALWVSALCVKLPKRGPDGEVLAGAEGLMVPPCGGPE